MTASLSSRTQQVLAVDISEMDTKLITAMRETSCLGWSARTCLAWHDLKVLSVSTLQLGPLHNLKVHHQY